MNGGAAKGEGSQADSTLIMSLTRGSNWSETKSRTINRLSHPDTYPNTFDDSPRNQWKGSFNH